MLGFKKILFIYRLGFKKITFKNFLLILKYFFKTKILCRSCPAALILGVTYRCQCNCSYCSIRGYPISVEKELTRREIEELIDRAVTLGVPKINFFGGEPLLRSDLVELVSYAAGKGLFVFLDTNGYLLDKNKVFLLKQAGISTININLFSYLSSDDNADEKNIEILFQRIKPLLKYCINENIPCIVSVYVDKNLIKEDKLKEIITFSKMKGASGVRLLLPMRCGGLLNDKNFLSKEDMNKVSKLVDNYFVYHESILYGIKNGKRICEARLKKTVYVSPYGDVQFCYTVPFSFGNIRDDSLKDIIQRMWKHKLFKMAPKYECAMNDFRFREICNKFKSKNKDDFIEYLYA